MQQVDFRNKKFCEKNIFFSTLTMKIVVTRFFFQKHFFVTFLGSARSFQNRRDNCIWISNEYKKYPERFLQVVASLGAVKAGFVVDDFFILPSLRRARGGAVVKFVEDCLREMVGVLPSSWTCLFTDMF